MAGPTRDYRAADADVRGAWRASAGREGELGAASTPDEVQRRANCSRELAELVVFLRWRLTSALVHLWLEEGALTLRQVMRIAWDHPRDVEEQLKDAAGASATARAIIARGQVQ